MKRTLFYQVFKLSLIAFVLTVSLSSVQAQTNSKYHSDKVFFDTNIYLRDVENQIFDLLKNSNTYMDTTVAKNQLKEKSQAVVSIKKVPVLKKELSSRELIQHLRKTTVAFGSVYDCGNCNRTHFNPASGYILAEEGVVVTNHHVVESFVKSSNNKNLAMAISTFEGKVYLVTEILSTDAASDLCIVKVDTRGDKLTPLAIGDVAEQGDEVFVMSHPNRMLYYFTKGVVARNYMTASAPNSRVQLPSTDITADYAAGSSGAPIVDIFGNLVSTVSSTRSIYYNPAEQKSLQMVVKQTKPVVLLRKMITFK